MALQLLGVRVGLGTQLGLTVLVLGALLCLGGSAAVRLAAGRLAVDAAAAATQTDWGQAMVFVFLAYGGWSDAATLSAELRDAQRRCCGRCSGAALVMGFYLLANWAYVQVLGLAGLARSEAPASELMRVVFGNGRSSPWSRACPSRRCRS